LKNILFIFGTRPEAIKLAPLWKELKEVNKFNTTVCVTGQHKEMLTQVLEFFNLLPEYDLHLMEPNQTLFHITAKALMKLESVLKNSRPDLVVVQGDTTTAFMGALAAYYFKVKIVHIEAGLRTYNKYSPYPEEINRRLIGHIADYHFAPTKKTQMNLQNEGINENVWVVGNTVIDALFLTLDIIKKNPDIEREIKKFFKKIIKNFEDIIKGKIILVTGHRRESFGEPFHNICNALKEISKNIPDINIIYPVHLNPNVRKPVYDILNKIKNVHLIEPLDYHRMIWLLNKSYIVLTDSGGIQEEAPSLGKPVLVMRDVTERMEGIEAGTAMLVGTEKENIIREVYKLLDYPGEYELMSKAKNPYGEGDSSKKIVDILCRL
jgi:UDP-N-acetylglucosamine 2-epimerase (non-hydrolysing)